MKKYKVAILLLLLVLVTNNLSAQWSGSGTQSSPFLINDSADLISLSKYVNKGNSTTSKYFRLEKDIDMANVFNYVPIGGWDTAGTYSSSVRPFSGSFDGNGKLIKNLSFHKDTTSSYSPNGRVGLFGYINNGAIIKNLGVVNCDFSGSICISAICGYARSSTIINCYSTGKISGFDGCGGICGFTELSTIEASFSKANVYGSNMAGGLIGHCSISTVKNCYSTGNISGITKICGLAYNNNCTYSDSYYRSNAVLFGTAGTILGKPIYDSLMKINSFIDSINNGLSYPSFKKDISMINNGYPILAWQDNTSIISQNAINIQDSSATINAIIYNPNQISIISKGFYYKNTLDSNWSVVNGIGDTNMYANLTGLLPNTNYEFKAFFVTSQLNTLVGDILTFKTLHTPARVMTDSASFIEPTRATLNGKLIIGSEPILTTGFYYKRESSSSYMLISTYFNNTDTLEADISGLIAKTEYTYKAFATTPTDTIYGEDINFITPAPVSLDEENISNTKFVIYPNPAKEYINVKFNKMNKNTNIIIFDISGREISNYSFSPIDNNYNARINTSNLLKGVYTLKIITNETTIAKKFIIE